MKTPYLDKEIEYLESIKKTGEISFYSSKKLEEYKEAKKQLSLCSVVVPEGTLCDVCGSENTIGAPHMGSNCLDCNPL